MEIHIEYELNERDYIRAMRLLVWSRDRLKRVLLKIAIFVSVCLLALFVWMEIDLHGKYLLQIVFGVVPALLLPMLYPLKERLHYAKTFRRARTGLPRTFARLDELGFHGADVLGPKEDYPWSSGAGVLESRHCFVVPLPASQLILILPKRAFTRAQVRDARILLRTHVPPDPKRLSALHLTLRAAAGLAALSLLGYYTIPAWFVRYSATHVAESHPYDGIVPQPLTDTSVAAIANGSHLQPFGCALLLPWPSHRIDAPPAPEDEDDSHLSEASWIRDETGPDGRKPTRQELQDIHQRFVAVSSFDQNDYLHRSFLAASPDQIMFEFSNPNTDLDSYRGIVETKSSFMEHLRNGLGPDALASRFNLMRTVLLAQPRSTPYLASPSRSLASLSLSTLKPRYLQHITARVPAYEFHLGPNRGFQFGDPARLPLNLQFDVFTPQDRHITYAVTAPHTIPQPQLNALAQSLACPAFPVQAGENRFLGR